MASTETRRWIPLGVWVIVVLTIVCIPGTIVGYGFLPVDDAMRHAAKVVSGKSWQEILVMRPDFAMDLHPGWHALLGALYRWQECGIERLVVLPVFGMAVLVWLVGALWLRRPEAWLAALLAGVLLMPDFMMRLMLGRPFLLSMAILLTLLPVWSRVEGRRPRLWELALTIGLLAAAAWIHGSFYLFALPGAAILLTGRWRQALWFGGSWLAGSFIGASFTGHPWQFLHQSLQLLFGAFGTHLVTRQLVGEFQPSDASCLVVLAVAAMLLWRSRLPNWKARELLNPIFMTGVLGWVLGLAVVRFWIDWGLPALLLWLALELQEEFERSISFESGKRAVLAAGLSLALFLAATADRDSRWTSNLTNEYLTPQNPELAGWLPGNDGIIYCADMLVFYETFFRNPTAPWRYVLGFEPALMQPEDLDVLRKFQWNHGDCRAFGLWVRKMRPNDRLIIRPTAGVPDIPNMEWCYALRDLWIGRLQPGTNSAAAPKAP